MEEKKGRTITITFDLWKISTIVLAVALIGVIAFTFFSNSSPTGFVAGGSVENSGSSSGSNSGSGLSIASLIDNDPKIGSDSAPVVIVEFSDFQCPFCRQFYNNTLSQIEENYIETGKVQLVYRDLPLRSIHPMAQKSAEASECAQEQGKWREIHNKIFDEQNKKGTGTVSYTVDDLKNWGKEIGLNETKFNECLDSGKYESEVEKDYSDAISIGVNGTPGFVIGLRNGEGRIISGAQPYSVFQSAIDSLLS